MKNIDKIRAMSAEELARFFLQDKCDNCSLESRIEGCYMKCVEGISEWLNQDKDINPMPKLQIGDVLEVESDGCRYYYIGNDEAVRTIHIHQSKNLPIVRRCVSDIKGDIVKIWREKDNSLLFGARRFAVIWRADDE